MRAPNRTYTEEFRSDALNLLRRGDRSVREVAAALGVSPWTLRDWYKKDEMARKAKNPPKTRPGPTPGESSDQRLARLERENDRLRKENDSLRMDREILKKAAAFFAKEST